MSSSKTTNAVSSIKLSFYTDLSHALYARLQRGDGAHRFTAADITQQLYKEGFHNYFITDDVIESLLQTIGSQQETDFLLASHPSYVNVKIEYQDDQQNLHAVIEATDRHIDLTPEFLRNEIDKQNFVKAPLNENLIDDLIDKVHCRRFGDFVISQSAPHSNLEIQQDSADTAIYCVITASETSHHYSEEQIRQLFSQNDVDNTLIDASVIHDIQEKLSSNHRGRIFIGNRSRAEITTRVDEDCMTAYLTVTPALKGSAFTLSQLKQQISLSDIPLELCDHQVLARIVKAQSAKDLAFAHGIEALHGKDTFFEPLVSETQHHIPDISKKDKINHREIIQFTEVEKGTPLMRRHAATEGKNGQDVKGQIIPAIHGTDLPYCEQLDGAIVSESDPDLLVATTHGHPVILKNGVKVDKTLTVQNVDLSTGNIHYDGSLMVLGEVFPGMQIQVTGDIYVQGVVNKAQLNAKNNITVMCGIIGKDPHKDKDESPPTVVKAGGNITAQYATQSKITAAGDIIIREYLSHCEVEAKRTIAVGQEGGKGKIIGGVSLAKKGLTANTIGSEGSIKTFVAAGTHTQELDHINALEQALAHRRLKAFQVHRVLKHQQIKKTGLSAKKQKSIVAAKAILEKINGEIAKLERALESLSPRAQEYRRATITVKKHIHTNTTLSINGEDFHVRQSSKGGEFSKAGNKIKWKAL